MVAKSKDKNKNKEKLEWKQLKELLFEFCEKEKRCPIKKEQYKNQNIGTWLQTQKKKIINKDKNKDKEKLEWKQLKELLFEFCEKEKRCPIKKEQYKNQNIGTWLQ